MLHPVAVHMGKRLKGASVSFGNGFIEDAKVADVQLVNRDVFGRGQSGFGVRIPARWF